MCEVLETSEACQCLKHLMQQLSVVSVGEPLILPSRQVKLFRNGKKGGAAERSPWWLQPVRGSGKDTILLVLVHAGTICEWSII